MRKAVFRPQAITIPLAEAPVTFRPISLKRLGRLRTNWFLMGSVFGVGISFFLNFVMAVVIIPESKLVLQGWKNLQTADNYHQLMSVVLGDPLLAPAEVSSPQVAAVVSAAAPAAAVVTAPPPPPIAYPRTLALKVGKGDTLLNMLIANHVQEHEAEQVVAALKPKVNAQKLPVGQKISVTLARHEAVGDKAAVKELAIRLPNFSIVELERLQNGKFNVAAMKEKLSTRGYRAVGVVKSSLFQAGADGNIPSSVMNEMVTAFAYDVDFQRDIHPGDKIEVLMDRQTTDDGRVGGYGAPRYAALTLRGKKKEIFRFKDATGQMAWFDAKGNSIKKSLLRTPVDAAHITSGFGMRTHPILGYTKMHRGVDFGAPTGTPIMAAGDGVVAFKGWKGGYGNFVVLRHNATYETAYGHVSRFADIKVGSRVKQGQVIAYVGMTGAATGPHLHYEVRKNDEQVNPVSKQFMLANGLTGKQRAAFNASKAALQKEMAALAKPEIKLASR
jgi:murein DD-endopeptidase MepM/ murein hydrolase activator NlpD